jgi:hypothetical protein
VRSSYTPCTRIDPPSAASNKKKDILFYFYSQMGQPLYIRFNQCCGSVPYIGVKCGFGSGFYLYADLAPASQTKADPCGSGSWSDFNFGKFPCSWIRIGRIPNRVRQDIQINEIQIRNTDFNNASSAATQISLALGRRMLTETCTVAQFTLTISAECHQAKFIHKTMGYVHLQLQRLAKNEK